MQNGNSPSKRKGITLLGLGPGSVQSLTKEAWDWLGSITTLYLRTQQHPSVADLPESLHLISFDDLLQAAEKDHAAQAEIVEKIIALGEESEGITYAVPGHPFIGEATCLEIARRAKAECIPVRVIDGLSFLEPTFSALEMDPIPGIVLVDALVLNKRYTPGFSPSSPVLITQISSQKILTKVKMTLLSVYPKHHPVLMVHNAGMADEVVEDHPLGELDNIPSLGSINSLFVPPLSANAAFESFQEVVARLRAPDGCPWDKAQTHESLRPYLIEEAYEAVDALDRGNLEELAEELGDLLLQIVLHAQVANENGNFNIHDVIDGIGTKLVRRHPHVFSEVDVEDVSGVIQNWEAIKAEERKGNGNTEKKGLLDGVPKVMPALLQADEIVERVGRVKLDHLAEMGTAAFVQSRLNQLVEAKQSQKTEILGELLLGVVSLAHGLDLEPESVLREAITRFRFRFGTMEARALAEGRPMVDLSADEVARLWEETDNPEN